jgi:hypothetical protein
MTKQMQLEGTDGILRRMKEYERRVLHAIKQVARYWQSVFEAYAKKNRPWDDQTGNARQSLHAWIEELSGDIVRLYLSHGVDYGIYLETKYSGRYAIIWPTIKRHLPQIRRMLQGIFKT